MTLTDEVKSSMECTNPYCNNAQVVVMREEDADKYTDVDSLKELSDNDLKAGRDKLMDILSNYAGFSKEHVILVFDAYKVPGGTERLYRYHNIVIFGISDRFNSRNSICGAILVYP